MNTKDILVNDQINQYRESSRSLWNNYFMLNFEETKSWNLIDSFNIIREELFKSIVIHPILDEVPESFSLGLPADFINIRLRGEPGGAKTTVSINRQKEDVSYWNHPINKMTAGSNLKFINLFDWNPYGFLDMSLVMAKIDSYKENPALEGHRLLVEIQYVDIVISDNS